MNLCPCGSEQDYESCCRPFHQGALAPSALLLMRSRYSAYVLNLADYIIVTTHPASPQYSEDKFSWRRAISQFCRNSSFQRLEVLDTQEKEKVATVTFTVHMSQKGQDATFTERSYFEKVQERWLYRGGQLAQGHAPQLVTTSQLRLLPLAYYGDPILREKTQLVREITDDVKKLVDEMIETMDACDGVGLAAPQVHHSVRLFVMRKPIEQSSGNLELGEVEVLINPKISLPSEETWKASEGCLSIPTIRSLVERPKEITVEYMRLDGTLATERVTGWEARVVLHETDHLDGVLFIDRLEEKPRSQLELFLQKLQKRIHDHKTL